MKLHPFYSAGFAILVATQTNAATGQIDCVLNQSCNVTTELCEHISPLPPIRILHGDAGYFQDNGPLVLAQLAALEGQVSKDANSFAGRVDLPSDVGGATRAYPSLMAQRDGENGTYTMLFEGRSSEVSTWWSLELIESNPALPIVVTIFDSRRRSEVFKRLQGSCKVVPL